MKWKERPYWFKGSVVGILFFIPLVFISSFGLICAFETSQSIFCSLMNIPTSIFYPSLIISTLLANVFNIHLPSFIVLIILPLLTTVIIGATIGEIIGWIIRRKKRIQNG